MDTNRMKELAEAAYKGEWKAVGESGAIHMGDGLDKYQVMMPNTWTARYVAAAKPATVLELIAVNEALAEALRPFFGLLQDHNSKGLDTQPIFGINSCTVTLGHLRAAKVALALQEKLKSGD